LVEALLLHRFSDNVRGLNQLARQLVVIHPKQGILRRSHLPAAFAEGLAPESIRPTDTGSGVAQTAGKKGQAGDRRRRVRTDDWPRLKQALTEHQGNVVQAASAVGLSRHQAYRLLKAHGDVDLRALRNDPARPTRRSEND
jgi:DNA-binding NtrC family response regulator